MRTPLGKQASDLRKLRGLTQVEAADAIGISRSTLAGIEASIDLPGRETLAALATYYGVTIDSLLGPTASGAKLGDDPAKEDEYFILLKELWIHLLPDERRGILVGIEGMLAPRLNLIK